MTRRQCRPVRLDQYVNHDPRLIFETWLVFKAWPVLVQLHQTHSLYLRPGLYLRKYSTLPPSPLPPKGHSSRPIFGQCLFWPNGWMDQDATCYGGRPRHRQHWRPSSPHVKGHSTPHTFQPMSVVAKRSPISATAELLSYMCCLFILKKVSCVVHVIQMKVPVK